MDLYQTYRQSRNMNNKYSGLSGSNNQLENYILARIQMSDNSQRIIFDPEDYDKALEAAAADLARRIRRYLQ